MQWHRFPDVFFPLQCCWQVILKWQSEDSEGGRRASGGVFVMCGPRAVTSKSLSQSQPSVSFASSKAFFSKARHVL
jgi:hypothetical protein